MEKTLQQLEQLEQLVKTLQLPDLTQINAVQGQQISARMMNLSGKLNQLAYRLLFSLDEESVER